MGCTPELEKFIIDYFDEKKWMYAYSVETQNCSNRHIHILLIGNKNSAKCTREKVEKSRRFPLILNYIKAMDFRTWYKNGKLCPNTGELIDTDVNGGLAYITKEEGQTIHYSSNWTNWEDVQQHLADHVLHENRRNAKWGQMVHWEELFHKHKLPYETWDDVSVGVSKLAFVLRQASLPDASKIKSTITYIHMFMNKFDGNLATTMDAIADQRGIKRKADQLFEAKQMMELKASEDIMEQCMDVS